VRDGTTGEPIESGFPDYSQYDTPPVMRNQHSNVAVADAADDLEMLDIPAFLRRQVD
jgi:3-deoxy-D-manno-octulosonic acid (KDO) 8-phosphate synthase